MTDNTKNNDQEKNRNNGKKKTSWMIAFLIISFVVALVDKILTSTSEETMKRLNQEIWAGVSNFDPWNLINTYNKTTGFPPMRLVETFIELTKHCEPSHWITDLFGHLMWIEGTCSFEEYSILVWGFGIFLGSILLCIAFDVVGKNGISDKGAAAYWALILTPLVGTIILCILRYLILLTDFLFGIFLYTSFFVFGTVSLSLFDVITKGAIHKLVEKLVHKILPA